VNITKTFAHIGYAQKGCGCWRNLEIEQNHGTRELGHFYNKIILTEKNEK